MPKGSPYAMLATFFTPRVSRENLERKLNRNHLFSLFIYIRLYMYSNTIMKDTGVNYTISLVLFFFFFFEGEKPKMH